jgi:hypothetical protein
MPVTACVTDQFKEDMLNGRAFSSDTIMVALYLSSGATLGPTTAVYTATGEISGTGYTAGGQALSGFTVGLSGNVAYLTWSNPVWGPPATITADTCLIYDSSNSNHTLAVLSFGLSSSSAGTFTIQFPAAGASSTITLT